MKSFIYLFSFLVFPSMYAHYKLIVYSVLFIYFYVLVICDGKAKQAFGKTFLIC